MLNKNRGIAVFSYLFVSLMMTFLLAACSPDKKEQITTSVASANTTSTHTDPAAGKSLSRACSKCHGDDGAKSLKGAPFIAGQQSEYLKTSIKAYADGHRSNEAMRASVESLTDADIANLTAYYTSLKSVWVSSRYQDKPKKTAVVSPADVARGKKIAAPCLSCHGDTGNSKQAGIPSLAGLQPAYLKSALKGYFNETRKDSVMKNFSHSIDNREVKQLAAFLSTLKRTKPVVTIKGNMKRGEKISAKVCAGCHGPSGNSQNPEIPSLTGQNTAYLVKAMKAYRNGLRKNSMMKHALKGIPSHVYADIAAFYAAQEPEKFGARKTEKEDKFDPIGDGETLAKTCNSCHGQHGNSTTAGIPSLSRLHPDYVKSSIAAYKSNTRKHKLMKSFVSALSGDDIEKLTLYYAIQEPATAAKPGKGDPKAGEHIALTCAGCHGEHGNSETANVPSLAGQNAQYIINALNAYRSGGRQQTDMQNAIKELKKPDFVNVAAYYAQQTAVKPDVKVPEHPVELSAKCDRCHGENGFSAVLNIPRIGGQVESYLEKSLHAYKSGARNNSAMHAMSDVLSNLEIRAIAKYYASQTQAP